MAVAQMGRDPGTLVVGGKVIKLVEWREDDFFDTVMVAVAGKKFADGVQSITAGTTLEFFRDLASKNLQHTNLRTPRRIPAGSEFIMTRVGVIPNQAFGLNVSPASDVVQIAYGATLTFKINDRLIVEGPLYKFQSGYGVTGSVGVTTAGLALLPSFVGLATIGVPSAAAAPSLLVAQPVQDDDDLMATLDFRAASWTGVSDAAQPSINPTGVTLSLHGFIKKPQGK